MAIRLQEIELIAPGAFKEATGLGDLPAAAPAARLAEVVSEANEGLYSVARGESLYHADSRLGRAALHAVLGAWGPSKSPRALRNDAAAAVEAMAADLASCAAGLRASALEADDDAPSD